MAWLTISSTAGVVLCTCLGYLVHAVYNHRRKINELRKQGVVSTPDFLINGNSENHICLPGGGGFSNEVTQYNHFL